VSPREERAALAGLAVLVLVLVADLIAWIRLGASARQLAEARAGLRTAVDDDGPTGDSHADLPTYPLTWSGDVKAPPGPGEAWIYGAPWGPVRVSPRAAELLDRIEADE
jgi:hypothetical protein